MARQWWLMGGTPGARLMCGCGAWRMTRVTAPTTTCTRSWQGGCVLPGSLKRNFSVGVMAPITVTSLVGRAVSTVCRVRHAGSGNVHGYHCAGTPCNMCTVLLGSCVLLGAASALRGLTGTGGLNLQHACQKTPGVLLSVCVLGHGAAANVYAC